MNLVLWKIFVFVFLQYRFCVSQTTTLAIGAIFHKHETDLKLAFNYAVRRRNLYHSDIKFKPIVEIVDESDTFQVQKILCNWTNSDDGLAAIVGPTSLKTSGMAQSIAETLEIPHIQIYWKPSKPFQETQNLAVNFYPDQNILSMGLAVVLKHMEWKNYIILYEDMDALVRLQEILKLAKKEKEPVIIRQLIGPDYRTIFKSFKETLVNQFIIDCSVESLPNIMSQANELGYLDQYYSYLLINLDSHTVNFTGLSPRANITTVRIIDPDSRDVKYVIHDWETGEYSYNRTVQVTPNTLTTEAALMHDAVAHFTEALSQLHITSPIQTNPISCDSGESWSSGFEITSYMKVQPKDSGVTGPARFDYVTGRRTYFVLEIVEYYHNDFEKSCEWYPDPVQFEHLNCSRSEGKKQQSILENLQKDVVIVSSRIGLPYLIEKENSDDLQGNDKYEGYSLDLIQAVANYLNFTFRIQITKGNLYGNWDPATKSWNGLIKDLLDRRAHIAICDLTITEARQSVVDFSSPFMTLGIGILYRKSKENETPLFQFMAPLETEVWLYIVTFYMCTTFALYLIARMAPGDWENPHPCDQNPEELENIWTLKNCLWLMLGSTMSQGCDILPKGISSRMATAMWWFFILIINSSYTANLAAFLTKDRMGSEINSAESLAAQTRVKYGTVTGGSTQGFFRDQKNNKVYEQMWTAMSEDPTVFEIDNAAGVKRVINAKKADYAFLMETSQIEYQIERNCNLKQVGGRLDNKGYGIAMPMNSPYRTAINGAVLKLQEDGILKELYIKWWKQGSGVSKCEDEEAASVNQSVATWSIKNVAGVFMVLGIGVGAAFIFAIFEFLWNVREVSLQEHITFSEAFKIEFKFAINVWVTEKRVKPDLQDKTSKSSKNDEEEKNVTAKILQGAGSFLQLDIFDKKL